MTKARIYRFWYIRELPMGAAPVERKGDIAEWENIFVKDLFI